MRHLSPRLLALSAWLLLLPIAPAEETPASQEMRELRQAVQQQSRQIELLAEQVGRLTRVIEGQKTTDANGAVTSVEAPKPVADPLLEVPKAEAVPKAEPVPSGPKHIVSKGETLTSIAKQYNIPIAELKNANKIENERKLQIGQILTVPTTKTPETSEKKENP